ncbi:MAG: aminopeptidase P family protein [candidate division Zixibacteria bacterium]
MKSRIDRLRKKLAADNIDAAVIIIYDCSDTTEVPGVRWLSGFSGSTGCVFVSQKSAYFISDFRYTEQAADEVSGAKIIISKKALIPSLTDINATQKKNLKVAIESHRLTIDLKNQLMKAMPKAIFIEYPNMLEDLWIIKDKTEIALLKKAAQISDRAFERILGFLRPGISEKEVAAELEYQMKVLGADKEAFPTIVASGYRSSMPHGTASAKILEKGDFITFDFGALYNGYVSDTTRTVVLGKATARQKRIYDTVLKAQLAGIKKAKAGVSGKAVDAACRNYFKKKKLVKYFGHGTGHGIGIEVHSGPRLSMLSKDILKSNMVVTIEPGLYFPGWGGVRIEDDVVIRPGGCTILTKAPKNLLEIG